MPLELKDMPRPPDDNGRGLLGFPRSGWTGGAKGYDFWVRQLTELGIKWFKVVDNEGDSIAFCEKLLAAGIFPIVRILRNDPPPNDSPEPNPGHIGDREEQTIRRLIASGVRYFETNNEPNLASEWKHAAIPGDAVETAKLVVLNWLFDARIILEAGGYPALPATSSGSGMDLISALVSLGRHDILLEGCWIAIHNFCLNRPLAYPDDPISRSGQPLLVEQYDMGAIAPWVWWNGELGRVNTLQEVNTTREQEKDLGLSVSQDHSCFRAFEYFDQLAVKYLGRSIPIISTDGGYLVGRRQDSRYGRVTPDLHRDQTVAMYDFMQRKAPDYYFAMAPRFLVSSGECEADAWMGPFWKNAFTNGTDGQSGIPQMPIPGVNVGDHLPVVDAVKAMPSVARQVFGVHQQPAPNEQYHASTDTPLVVTEPSPTRYVVAKGDTLVKIAARYGTTWLAVAEANDLEPASTVRPGQILLIPTLRATDLSPESELLAELENQKHPTRYEPAMDEWEISPTSVPYRRDEASFETTTPDSSQAILDADIANQPIISVPNPPPSGFGETATVPTSSLATQDNTVEEIQQDEQVLSYPPLPQQPKPGAPPLSMLFGANPMPLLDWDPRLDALRITFFPAQVATGEIYWKLVRAEYLGPTECEGKHQIYYVLEDEEGKPARRQRVWQGWPEDRTDATTNENGMSAIPLWASFSPERGETGPYSAWVDGLPSDRVGGMGLPSKRHVSFSLTWRCVKS